MGYSNSVSVPLFGAPVMLLAIWGVAYAMAPRPFGTFKGWHEESFEHRHTQYMRAAETITTLGSASLALIPSLICRVDATALKAAGYAVPFVLFGWSVFFAVAFMALLTVFYEQWMYSRSGETYTPWKYGLIRAIGFSALLCFGFAYLWLAIQLGNAVASGATIVNK